MARVLIPLARGFEELEAVTVIDLLRRAEVEVITAGLEPGPVKASRGTVIIPDALLDDVRDQDFDMLVFPGGLPGADILNGDQRIHDLLANFSLRDKFVAAVCAAPKILATAGLLNGRSATSFPGALDGIPTVDLDYREQAVVIDGKFVTSRGPGTSMDFALTLIELLCGEEKKQQVEAPLQRP